MHVVFRESHGLEETATPYDPGQTPADLVVLSFSDSDLGAFAAGWHRGGLPSLRLCNLVALRHPVSTDEYADTVLAHAKGILIRIIGGESYWPHGLAVVQDIARRRGIALAVLPADGRPDERLDALSTLPISTLRRLSTLCDAGGEVAAQAALAQLALAAGLYAGPVAGEKSMPQTGLWCPDQGIVAAAPEGPLAIVTFYRSWLVAADTAPIAALIRELRAKGTPAIGLFAPSLKTDITVPANTALIINATAFSAQGADPFDGFDIPVMQVALSTARRRDWASSERGLSPPDLAMNVALPEVDGRIFAGVVSFKSPSPRDPDLQYSRFVHRPDPERITAAVDRALAWKRLRDTPAAERKIAIVLSTYPGRPHQMAHAVGLDALASADRLRADLVAQGYRAENLHTLLQPERGGPREESYHDLTREPSPDYIAFYENLHAHAMVHMGAHGTLEWLPGKSVALSATCWPERLVRDMPVIYPFIVNDPGEAAQAKRRIGAVTLSHMPPPLVDAALPDRLAPLERLLDEYSTAEGLDPARRDRLIAAIRLEAQSAGVEDDLAIPPTAAPAEAIPRIDRFVCDLKETRFGDGLHIYGAAAGETDGILAALDGRRVAAGPSGSPARGRTDVIPTGRNMFAVDPRAVPSPAAHAHGIKLAEELLRRHLQDHGDWPQGLVVDLWGSATMRTAGEDFAMALHLAGLEPMWHEGRVTGVAVIAQTLLGRPRIDVTLRVSGLFRDTFPTLAQMFETGAAALAGREETGNPYQNRSPRVFGPQPGQYGLGLRDFDDAAGQAWLDASSWVIGADGEIRHDPDAIAERVRHADSFAHSQDLAESDLLLAADYAAHEGGFAAAASLLGASPTLYHIDATRDRPHARTLTEEIARVVRARAASPDWVAGMMRHGFRGGAEIAATLEHMTAFAHLARAVPPHLFDLYHDATLGRPEVVAFLSEHNPEALTAMQDLFRELAERGLWQTRRNSIAATL